MNILSLFLLKGLVVAGVATLVWFLLRRRAAVLRDRIWTMAFAALLAVMFAPLLPSWSVPMPQTERVHNVTNAVADPVPQATSERDSVTAPLYEVRQHSPQAPASAATSLDVKTIARWATFAWAFGAIVLLACIALEAASLAATRRKARLAPGALLQINKKCASRIGLRRIPPVYISDAVPVPIVFGGWRRSTVLLPEDAANWSRQRLESVLLHELAHVCRNDPMITLLSAIACALHWVNPLVWWAARRAATDREEACDMRVLATGTDRFSYAQDLIDTARGIHLQYRSSPLCLVTVPRMASVSSLYQRVEALLRNATPVTELGRTKSRAIVIVTLAALIPIACAKIADQANEVAGVTSGSDAVMQLLDTALDPEVRLRAAWKLGEREDENAVDALLTTLEDEDPALRGMSAWALGEIKDASVLPHLIAAIADVDPKAREMAIRAVGEIDDPRTLEPLIDATQLPNEEHRAAAVRALGDLDWSADARTALEAAIADSSTVVRKAAVFAIAESGYYDGAADTLMPLLNDDSAHVRALAAESLGVIGNLAAIDALIAASRDNDPEVRAWAVWALDEIEER